MSFQIIKDDFSQMKEEGYKTPQRKASNFITQNSLKNSLILQAPSRLNKSITKLRMKRKKTNNEANIIKDYLHYHKFGLQRKEARKVTIKIIKKNPNDSFMNNRRNSNEYNSMIYYPEERKKKKIQAKIYDLREEETTQKTNLKRIENLLFNKLHNMKFNLNQNEVLKGIDNNNNIGSIFNLKNNENPNTYGSDKNNKSVNNIYYKNKFKNKKNKSITSSFFRQNSINDNANNIKSAFFPNIKENGETHKNKEENFRSEILQVSHERTSVDYSDKNLLPLNNSNQKFHNKGSSKSINLNIVIKEKSRILSRIKQLYDSFDDDESDKEDENNSSLFLPSSPIIFFLDIFLFISSFYSLFYIPLRMAKADCFCSDEHRVNKILLYFIDILYIFDFCISFFRAYYNYQLKLVKRNKNIIIHYLKTDGAFDFLEAIPVFSLSKYLCTINEEVNYCFKYNMSTSLILLKIMTNAKIIKIFKIKNKQRNITFNYILDLFSENYSFEKFLDNLIDFSFVFLAFHFFVCLNIFLAKQTYPNWLIAINAQDQNLLYNYITSSYSLVETLTTVGYGEITCQNMPERIFQIFFLGVGVIAYSYIISSFGNLFKNESQSSIKNSNNMKILEEIRIDYPNLSFKLYKKIYNYIESRSLAEKKLDVNILTNSLPFNLRNALLLIMYESCIKNFKILKNCDNSNFIIQILSKFVPAVSKKSEILVYEGEMIEEIIIVKDGRLSLEAAIDIDDPEKSIRNYFNINFQGITTAKEMKKLEEANKKLNNSHLISYRNIRDYDNAKFVLNDAVKKQVKFLFNSVCEDTSILDKTTNDNINKNIDFLKNEPIKNEQGNFKYIKIIDIRKNENYGGLYMFMRRPSPLSLKVKSKFAELYLLSKKDVFSIAKSYNNIWSKIHKKDFHNMLSIKHHTFNILNKYIEINGIMKINPNEMSRYVYAWEEPNKNNKLNDKSYSFFSKQIQKNVANQSITSNSPNKTPIKKTITPDLTPINKNNNDIIIKKTIEIISPKSQSNQPVQTDFSHLLTLMTNGRQTINNTLSIKNTLTNKNNSDKNLNIVSNKELNIHKNNSQEKESYHSISSKIFNKEKKNTNISNEKRKTLIMSKEDEALLPFTLNSIFNENKAEELKEQMQKSKKREIFKKLLFFGKKAAELFKNDKYYVILADKQDELIELKNNNFLSSKNLIKDNEKFNDCLSLCQNNLFFENIPEISFEDNINHFDNKNLTKEGVISFCFEPIYQNINTITNMQYSKNKIYQEKTIKFLKKLTVKKDSSSIISFEKKTNSFSKSISDNNKSFSLDSISEDNKNITHKFSVKKSMQKIDLLKLFSDSIDSKEDSNNKSAQLFNGQKHRKSNKNKEKEEQKFTVGNSMISRGDLSANLTKTEFQSLKPKKTVMLDSPKFNSIKKKRISKNLKKNTKFNFKIDSHNENSSINTKKDNPLLKKKRVSGLDKRKRKRMSEQKSGIFFGSENSTHIQFIKNSKTTKKNFLGIENDINKGSHLTENKSSNKEKCSKASIIALKSEKNINSDVEKSGIRNSKSYFAKEKKEDCKLQ